MSQDAATRARWEGRQAIALRTLWQLTAGPVSLRCVIRTGDFSGGVLEVQARTDKGWTRIIATGDDAFELLQRVTVTSSMKKALSLYQERTDG